VRLICADLFCGAGGTSSGLIAAARELQLEVDLIAVNHWPAAIATHSANYPWARHICARIEAIRPREVVPGGRLHLLVASPECTHHSVARGGRPIEDQKRVPAWHVIHWAQELFIENIVIENVAEFRSWGPIGANGKPLKSKKGETYEAFLQALRSLGYRVDERVLCCADYGDATTRRRLFILATRKGSPSWPLPTHAPRVDVSSQALLFGSAQLQPWRVARDIIDWSLRGENIFARKKPLAEKTLRRIVAGMKKINGMDIEPFLVMFYGTNKTRSIDKLLPTVTANGQHIGLCEPVLFSRAPAEELCSGKASSANSQTSPDGDPMQPFLIAIDHRGGNGSYFKSVDLPTPTITTKARLGVAEPFLVGGGDPARAGEPRSVDKPLNAVLTRQSMAVVEPFLIAAGGPEGKGRNPKSVHEPLDTVLTENHQALVQPFVVAVNHGDEKQVASAGRCQPVDQPMPTLTYKNGFGVVEPYVAKYYGTGVCQTLDEPLDTVTTKDRFALVEPCLIPIADNLHLGICFRMLQPHELAAAQGFAKDYKFEGNKSTKVKQIGNAVPHHTAKALCRERLKQYAQRKGLLSAPRAAAQVSRN
jgi:DNA (cytosine-5)-methyltransferase 1